MARQNPLVSVIIPTFNESKDYISQSLDSVLQQTYQDFEIIILDDSTDESTRSYLDEYGKDERIRIIRNAERMGLVHALNVGLESANGKYIARMDADDICLPDRFEKQVRHLEEHPEIAVLGGQMDLIDESNNVLSHRSYPTGGIKLLCFSLLRSPLAHPTVMLRQSLVAEGLRYNEEMKKSEDMELWIRLIYKHYKLANLPDTILKFRVGEDFNEKRLDEQQKRYVAYARKKNMSLSRPFYSLFSLVGMVLYQNIPRGLFSYLYNKENGK